MDLEQTKAYIDRSYADYFNVSGKVYDRISLILKLARTTSDNWGFRDIFECGEEGEEI